LTRGRFAGLVAGIAIDRADNARTFMKSQKNVSSIIFE
jgi:hypothetical protein